MFSSILELEESILELEKAGPAIRKTLDLIPTLKKIIAAAGVFNSATNSFGRPINKGSHVEHKNPEAQESLFHSFDKNRDFTGTIMKIMRSENRALTPKEVKKILIDFGYPKPIEPQNKVATTMNYLMNKRKFLEGDGIKGYRLTSLGVKGYY